MVKSPDVHLRTPGYHRWAKATRGSNPHAVMLDFRQGMSILRFKGLSADKQEETGRLGLGIQRGLYLTWPISEHCL